MVFTSQTDSYKRSWELLWQNSTFPTSKYNLGTVLFKNLSIKENKIGRCSFR